MKKAITFYSEGCKLAGDLYLPDTLQPGRRYPAVVLCHGFAGIKEILLPPFAEAFASQGFVSLVFDYRGFGDSEGEKGRLVHADQIRDIRNAITYIQSLEEVNPEQVGLWGTSYGGANAIGCAAQDKRVKCLAVQLTFANGERVIMGPLDEAGRQKLKDTIAKVWTRSVVQNKSLALGPAQLLTDEQSKAFFSVLLEQHPKLNVKIPFLFIQHTLEHKPEEYLTNVHVPLLVIAAEKDLVNPPEESRILFEKAREPKALVMLKDATHYECYTGDNFAVAAQKAVEWLTVHLK